MQLKRSFSTNTAKLFQNRGFNFRLQNIISATALPLFALYISANYGHFLWGDFYRIWLWLMSLSFILQMGSVQMILNEETEYKLQEIQDGINARIVLLLVICILLFFLALPVAEIIILIAFLVFRFAGDSMLAYHATMGKGTRTLRAELIFWLILLLCLLVYRDSLSTRMLLRFVVLASLFRVFAADITLIGKIFSGRTHAPDREWFRNALFKFLPAISGFLFYYIDMLLASFLLPAREFSEYTVTMFCILLPSLVISVMNLNDLKSGVLRSLIICGSIIIVSGVLLKLVLMNLNHIQLSPYYFIYASSIGLSSVYIMHFMRRMAGFRTYNTLHLVTAATTIVYLLSFPYILRTGSLEFFLMYQSSVHLLLLLVLLIINSANQVKKLR
jgi:hypothetical protein